jgi:hypothetical protein
MTAKEYLNQIREKDAAINRMIRQKENLKGMLYTIGSPGTGEKVNLGVVVMKNCLQRFQKKRMKSIIKLMIWLD